MNKYKSLNRIKKSKSLCLISHIEPDPDALASMVVFQDFIRNKFKIHTVDMFAECEKLSKNLTSILKPETINSTPKTYDVAIMLDCPNTSRLGKYESLFLNTKEKIVIDHHATNNFSGDINIVEICSSTCEIIYSILKSYKYKISSSVKGKLYSGIITDTNNFTVGEITSRTYEIVSQLISNINRELIYKTFLANTTLKNKQLEALAIKNLSAYENNQILISHISHDEAKEHDFKPNDFTGIINNLAKINSAKLVCLIQSKNNEYYVSMRAKSNLDVSKIARENGGGGHIGAAAFNSNLDINTIKKTILESFLKEIKTLSNIEEDVF